MKKLIVIFFLTLSFIGKSQEIGDRLEYLLDNKSEFDITMYRFAENHFEAVSINDTVTTIYIVGFKPRKVFGIDYLYLDRESLLKGLKTIINEAYSIGYDVWMKDNLIITARELDIIVRDVNRSKRIPKRQK